MLNTKLKYLEDSYLFEDHGKILEIGKIEDKTYILLDQSIFYPQGGGQPYDLGQIKNDQNIFDVSEVRFNEGITYHFGTFLHGELKIDENVDLKIDSERRKLHCRLHSAGHLVDTVFHELGFNLKPLKGYHFPDGPYVEYVGELGGNLEEISKALEIKINEHIEQGNKVSARILENSDNIEKILNAVCYSIPDHIPAGKPIRIVFVYGNLGEPCGGTHVKDIKDIGRLTIPKIKVKGGNTRISYKIE